MGDYEHYSSVSFCLQYQTVSYLRKFKLFLGNRKYKLQIRDPDIVKLFY